MKSNVTKLAISLAMAMGWLASNAVPALAQYRQMNLTGYQPGMGRFLDPRLNGWGMVSLGDGSFCVANTSTGVATFYDQSGKPLPMVVTVPPAPSQPFGPIGSPAGIAFNPTSEFVISKNGRSAPARLIFANLDGTISGWNPEVDASNAIIMVDNSAELPYAASYEGLALGQNSKGRNVLYAADGGNGPTISNNRFDMLDGAFQSLGSFTDPDVAIQYPGNTAFQVEYEDGKLFVTFGGFTAPFGGVVDVFDADGNLLTPNHFAANAPGAGPLCNPWAIVHAPAHFGKFSNTLLIGNVEDGKITAFNPDTGAFLGSLTDSKNNPIVIPGLWDLSFGNGRNNGRASQLFFDAGPTGTDFSGNGLFGVIIVTGAQGDRD